MSLMEFKDVSLSFHKGESTIQVLDRINLNIDEGDFITIVGPSGCGKSSLLKLAAGIIFPTAGKVLFYDKEITGTEYKRGMMFQDPTLFPWLTVKENVSFGLNMRGIKKKEVDQLSNSFLKKMDLQDFADSYPYTLSGGMKQRVSLVRTLINDPDIILMDEPFASLDAFMRQKMQELLLNIWLDTKKTILFVTHDVEEAILLGTKLVVMAPRPSHIIEEIPIDINPKKKLDINIFQLNELTNIEELKRKIYKMLVV